MADDFACDAFVGHEERGRFALELDPRWRIRGLFGGYSFAVLLRACSRAVDRPDLVPASASATFFHPAAPGTAQAVVDIARSGRTVVAANADLRQRGRLTVSLRALFVPRPAGEDDRADAPVAAEPPATVVEGPNVHRQVVWSPEHPWLDRRQPGSAPTGSGEQELRARIRPADGAVPGRHWLPVAADLLGPALMDVAAEFPFEIMTLAMSVELLASPTSDWLHQLVHAGVDGDDAWGRLTLTDESGRLVAIATQRARLRVTSEDELPFSVTGFGQGQ
ncbi:MAG: thioesterase family protein [Solirubrobacteraceae bacterium]